MVIRTCSCMIFNYNGLHAWTSANWVYIDLETDSSYCLENAKAKEPKYLGDIFHSHLGVGENPRSTSALWGLENWYKQLLLMWTILTLLGYMRGIDPHSCPWVDPLCRILADAMSIGIGTQYWCVCRALPMIRYIPIIGWLPIIYGCSSRNGDWLDSEHPNRHQPASVRIYPTNARDPYDQRPSPNGQHFSIQLPSCKLPWSSKSLIYNSFPRVSLFKNVVLHCQIC